LHHNIPLISTLAAGFGLALLFGLLADRLKLPSLVGYLLAGILIGPFTPGFVADAEIAAELAEIGVMLLMFGVGLHFSLDDLLEVRKIALPGAVLQIAVATALGAGVAHYWGWGLGPALVFGLALSVASTVVLLRALESRGELDSLNGRIAVGWLVVEDLAMVLVLVLLPPLAGWLGGTAAEGGDANSAKRWADAAAGLGICGAFMLVIGKRLFPRCCGRWRAPARASCLRLCVVAAAVGIAYGAGKLFGVSFALGAFFAGMVMRESEFSHRAAKSRCRCAMPLPCCFLSRLACCSTRRCHVQRPLQVLAVVAIIIVGKSLAAALWCWRFVIR
jgi:CPA2 family monovalent cation:H+ antiporter-2